MKLSSTYYSFWICGFLAAPLLAIGALVGCNSEDETMPNQEVETETGLTPFEMEHGIGPVDQHIVLDDQIDEALAARGEEAYIMKCESCHRMETRLVGPPLGDVLERRSPEFTMNFILNPQEMIREHPEGQLMLREYLLEMPYQNVDLEEARAILEYLRTQQ